MASKVEVNPQSFSDSGEKENLPITIIIAILVGIITAGENLFPTFIF